MDPGAGRTAPPPRDEIGSESKERNPRQRQRHYTHKNLPFAGTRATSAPPCNCIAGYDTAVPFKARRSAVLEAE